MEVLLLRWNKYVIFVHEHTKVSYYGFAYFKLKCLIWTPAVLPVY